MEKEKNSRNAVRRPDCVTETRMGNTILVVLLSVKLKRGHIRQIKSRLIHGNCQKTVGLSSLISSDYKKKKLPMQIKTQAVS